MLRRLWEAYLLLDGLRSLAVVLLGVGCIGYLAFEWLVYWLHGGRYMLALSTSISIALLTVAAIIRVPIALVLLFGAAVMLGVLFASGNGDAVLPR